MPLRPLRGFSSATSAVNMQLTPVSLRRYSFFRNECRRIRKTTRKTHVRRRSPASTQRITRNDFASASSSAMAPSGMVHWSSMWPTGIPASAGTPTMSAVSRNSCSREGDVALARLLRAAERSLRNIRAQLLGERAIVRGARAEFLTVGGDLALKPRCAHRDRLAVAPRIENYCGCSARALR